MYRRISMQETTMCFSRLDKPGKDEKPQFMPRWATIKNCPDCDTKRIGLCKDPLCVHTKIN
jgi:hypothetical protein